MAYALKYLAIPVHLLQLDFSLLLICTMDHQVVHHQTHPGSNSETVLCQNRRIHQKPLEFKQIGQVYAYKSE